MTEDAAVPRGNGDTTQMQETARAEDLNGASKDVTAAAAPKPLFPIHPGASASTQAAPIKPLFPIVSIGGSSSSGVGAVLNGASTDAGAPAPAAPKPLFAITPGVSASTQAAPKPLFPINISAGSSSSSGIGAVLKPLEEDDDDFKEPFSDSMPSFGYQELELRKILPAGESEEFLHNYHSNSSNNINNNNYSQKRLGQHNQHTRSKSILKNVENPFPVWFGKNIDPEDDELAPSHIDLFTNPNQNDSNSQSFGANNSVASSVSRISLMSYKSFQGSSTKKITRSSRTLDEEDWFEEYPELLILQKNDRTVKALRIGLVLFMTVAALGVGLAVYFYTQQFETDGFETQANDSAVKILNRVGHTLDTTMAALDSYVVGVVSFARYTGMQWPFVTYPDHAVKMAKIRGWTKAINIIQYNLVPNNETRVQWEEYSTANNGWVEEALQIRKRDPNFQGGHESHEYSTIPVLFNLSGPLSYEAEGPFLPSWQTYPFEPISFVPPYNFDGSQHHLFQQAFPDLTSRKASFSEVNSIPRDPTNEVQVQEAQLYVEWATNYIGPDEEPNEPFSTVYYPITDCAADFVSMTTITDSESAEEDCNLVGVVAMAFYWRNLLKDSLTEGNNGMVAVIDSTCNQSFSYEINGPDVRYLGPKDMHNPDFDHLGLSADIHNFGSSSSESGYTGLLAGTDNCQYSVHVYPSESTQDEFTSDNPTIYTVTTCVIFFFSTILFLLYDRCNEGRQRLILQTALASNANVEILEQKVLERTARLERSNKKLEKANARVTQASARQLQTFASMSHEIRTPLNCIIGLSSLMQESTSLDQKQAEYLQMMVSSGELLQRVVNDVLDYSKLEAGKVVVEIQQSSLQDALNAVVRSIETNALSRNVSVETHYDYTVGEFFATDSRRLQQILYNLLGNSIKFSSEEGVVELWVQHCILPPQLLKQDSCDVRDIKPFGQDQQVLRFVVKDYGKGIQKENFEKIFVPFSQAENSTERLHGGTGLGLAITAKLVKALGGSISVDSEFGEWTEMRVDFPCEDQQTVWADLTALSARLNGCRVMLVGDARDRDIKGTAVVFQKYSIGFEVLADMKEVEKSDSKTKLMVLLVHEDLYNEDTFRNLTKNRKALLLTFGHKFSVQSTAAHFRCLTQMLPSVLISRMGDCVENATLEPKRQEELRLSEQARKAYLDYRVLIAEDNVVNQKVLVRILNKIGVKNVVVVDNGQKAVDKVAAETFNVVLMDLQMPVLDGIDACRIITKEPQPAMLPKIVFVTAHALDHYKDKCRAAGGSGFLAKPFRLADVEQTFEKLQALIEGRGEEIWS